MKNFAALFFLILVFSIHSNAQTGTATVLNEPCNLNDGVLAVEVSGMTPPLHFYYYSSNEGISHISNSLMDTAYGLASCFGVYISPVNGQQPLYLPVSMPAPFDLDWPVITNPECPDTMGTLEITINNGQPPQTVSWHAYDTINGLGAFLTNTNPADFSVNSSYAAIVEDGGGCSMLQIILGQDAGDSSEFHMVPGIVPHYSTVTASCDDGEVVLDSISGGTGPFTYEWNTGQNSANLDNLITGWYTCAVTDAEGCTGLGSAFVYQSPWVTTQFDVTDATCLQNDGQVMGFGSGGTPPYDYQWSTGFSGNPLTGLEGGEYVQLFVTDANGCVGNGGTGVGTSTPITVTYSATPSACNASDGTATLDIANGTPPYSVTWATFPVQTGITATGLEVGNYNFTVEDAVGCIRTGIAQIQSTSQLGGYVNVTHAVCPNSNGAVAAVVNGSNPPFTYQWSNGPNTVNQTGVPAGGYYCTITDDEGCTITKYGHVGSISPVHLGIDVTPASCLYTCDGEVFANATGGTPPYTYGSSIGQTTQLTTGWCEGPHKVVYATDANGCYDSEVFIMPHNTSTDDCYCTIKGKVFEDLNGNCQYDSGEPPMNHVMIHCSGYGYKFTNANGDYEFKVPAGNYTITENILAFYPLAPCQQNEIEVVVSSTNSGCEYSVDFANVVNPIHDLHVMHMNAFGPPVPGNDYTFKTVIRNDGTLTEPDAILGFYDDGQILYNSSGPVAFTQQNPIDYPNWYSINSGLGTITPGNSVFINTEYTVPTNIPLQTELVFHDTAAHAAPMNTYLSDYSPWDNTSQIVPVVVGSYDPNYVEVHPRGLGPEGYIERTDSILDYIIHFQNTGSYYAQNVFILDTLDDDLDLMTFRPGYSDHEYTVEISEDRVVRFNFDGIMLPWQSITEYGSRGLVSYSIRQIEDLPIGTEINCTAGIYFDYNEPVITNTTVNTIGENVAVDDLLGIEKQIVVYPNPTSNSLHFKFSDHRIQPKGITIYDLTGREVYRSTYVSQINVSGLSAGNYVIAVSFDQGVFRQKVVITD